MPLRGLATGEGGDLEQRSLSYVEMPNDAGMRDQVEDIVRQQLRDRGDFLKTPND